MSKRKIISHHIKLLRVEVFQPGEEMISERPHCGLKGTYKKEAGRFLLWADSDKTRGNGFKMKEFRFRLDVRRNSSLSGW